MKHKTYEEQLEIFVSRGMEIENKEKALEKIKNISYYKLKKFADPFYIDGKYQNINFERIMMRFYEDKNIRINLLHAIEKIEISLKNKIAYLLGEKDPFLYLDFKKWVERNNFKNQLELLKKQEDFKENLTKLINKNNEVKAILNSNSQYKDCEFPPVWISLDLLTFGSIYEMFELLPKHQKEKISTIYKTTPSELSSWISTLKFIRNLSAHNFNIIDLKIKTLPKVKKEWLKYINKEDKLPIGVIFFIVRDLVREINPDYNFEILQISLQNLVGENDGNATKLGFINKNGIYEIRNKILNK